MYNDTQRKAYSFSRVVVAKSHKPVNLKQQKCNVTDQEAGNPKSACPQYRFYLESHDRKCPLPLA